MKILLKTTVIVVFTIHANSIKKLEYNWRRKHSLATEPTAHVSPLVNSALRNPKRTDRHVFPVKTATATDFLTPEKTRLDPYKAALHDLNRYNQSLFPNNSSQKEKWRMLFFVYLITDVLNRKRN